MRTRQALKVRKPYVGMGMNPVSTPLARVRDVHHVSGCLAVRNATLGYANGTIVPSSFVRKHAMVVEGARTVKIVCRVHD